jgi:hypothetical protein
MKPLQFQLKLKKQKEMGLLRPLHYFEGMKNEKSLLL